MKQSMSSIGSLSWFDQAIQESPAIKAMRKNAGYLIWPVQNCPCLQIHRSKYNSYKKIPYIKIEKAVNLKTAERVRDDVDMYIREVNSITHVKHIFCDNFMSNYGDHIGISPIKNISISINSVCNVLQLTYLLGVAINGDR